MGLDLFEVCTELQVHRSSIIGSLMIPPQIAEISPQFPLLGLTGSSHTDGGRIDFQRPKIYGIDVSKDLLDTGVLKVAVDGKAHRYIPT